MKPVERIYRNGRAFGFKMDTGNIYPDSTVMSMLMRGVQIQGLRLSGLSVIGDGLKLSSLPKTRLVISHSRPASNHTPGVTPMENIIIPRSNFLIARGSSKGDARKAQIGDVWYKCSAGTFNAQAEAVASRLAAYTNLGRYVKYEICKVNGEYATKSLDFIGAHRSATIKSLYMRETGHSIEDLLMECSEHELFAYVCRLVKRMLGLDIIASDIVDRLSLWLQFDYLILNDDRHFGNIMFIQYDTGWDLAPDFDYDCALYSTLDDLSNIPNNHRAQPFFMTQVEQYEFALEISKARLVVSPFKADDLVRDIWEDSYTIGKREIISHLKEVGKRYGFEA